MNAKGTTQICISPFAEPRADIDSTDLHPRYLIVVDGGIPGTMLELAETGASIGRSAENTIQFVETSVSRNHAFFSVDFNGHVGLSDLGSTNGTYLNGQRLQPNAPAWVRNGDRVQIGSSIVLKFVRLDPLDERFQRELFERMVRDPLTGLFNRGYFQEQIGPLVERNAGSGSGLAVMLLDLDRFKRINDSFGHDAGDHVLKEVAQVLRESTRPDDLVARYGGEEFVLAIPIAGADLALNRAERIRKLVRERPISYQGRDLRVTLSLGMTYRQAGRGQDPGPLITAADHALYQAKRHGRDRVVFKPDECPSPEGESHSSIPSPIEFSALS